MCKYKFSVLAKVLLLLLGGAGLLFFGYACDDDGEGGPGAGPGGGPGVTFDDPSKTPTGNVSTDNAEFYGMNTSPGCILCHPGIVEEYATQAHGMDFHNHPRGDLITGFGGSCAPCHTTGFDEPTGYNAGGVLNAALEQIQCEECHGPASNHMGDPSGINRVADASQTCWDCHVADYKQLRGTVGAVTDADLEEETPEGVTVHHPQALMLNGVYGYEYPDSTYSDSAHTGIFNSCMTCHLFFGPDDEVTHGAEALEPDDEACASCHQDAAALQALHEETEQEILDLLIQLGGEDPENPGEPDHDATGGLLAAWADANGIDLTTNDNPTDPAVQAYKAARHNFAFVLNDASHGVHNASYARQLLEDSIESLSTP